MQYSVKFYDCYHNPTVEKVKLKTNPPGVIKVDSVSKLNDDIYYKGQKTPRYSEFQILLTHFIQSFDEVQMTLSYEGECGEVKEAELVYKLNPQSNQEDYLDGKITPSMDS